MLFAFSRYSPSSLFFYLSFFFFLIIFIIAKSYIFFIGSDETGSDRVFRNSNRNDFGNTNTFSIEFLSYTCIFAIYIYFFSSSLLSIFTMDIYIYISKYRIFRLHFFFPCTDRLQKFQQQSLYSSTALLFSADCACDRMD